MVALAVQLLLLEVADGAAEAGASENLCWGDTRPAGGKAKVGDLETAVGSDEDVVRLQVEVDHTIVVHVADTVADVTRNLPYATLVHALVGLAVDLEERSKRTDTGLSLDVELSILLPSVHKEENVWVGVL